ncbi:MAG: tRNA (guanosine(37)-N1)-methyltransferase TrmD [Candidatus Magasanikbacteria bacterium]|nr:tRNA (guanosine(37)-N1)-methyltransferase TrmD [Candidatus Magasanikbacteria bacterium]
MRFDILTIFPKIIKDYSSESILKRGQKKGLIKIEAHDFRRFARDKHRKVDDAPYGGGAGMVLKVEPIYCCLESLGLVKNNKNIRKRDEKVKVIILDPAGKKFDQKMAGRYAKLDRLVLICGRYEGFDERVYKFVDEKISIGDYVLSGGELPALVVTEAVARLVPEVLGNPESLKEETFEGFVEYPQYTRPENFSGLKVPKVLLSGYHKKIEEWRRKKSR